MATLIHLPVTPAPPAGQPLARRQPHLWLLGCVAFGILLAAGVLFTEVLSDLALRLRDLSTPLSPN